ncbi:MAG: transglycosylase domain-containing protein [Hyphomonas sp.]|nr:transglycosylase domain-containing protein [Hyphomonas sp.]
MKMVRRVILLILITSVAVPAAAFAVVWNQAAAAIERSEAVGTLRHPRSDSDLTVAERAVAIAEFESTWNVRNDPCRSIAQLWNTATHSGTPPPGMPVSSRLAATILMEVEQERSLRLQFVRLFADCQLEQRYSDTQMLRAWLSNAHFGAGSFGIENAAQSLFGKYAADLSAWESAKLAALLRTPRLRNDPESWSERATFVADRVATSNLP